MAEFKHENIQSLPGKHRALHPEYEYVKREFIPRDYTGNTWVTVYEVPPGKAAYPYHYHLKDEETFYIVSGEGLLRTPQGERHVATGDLLFFPAGEEGAHKLTNTSDTEKLIYIDFDVIHDLDVAVYPDSQKIGVWGKGINRLYPMEANVDYYDGE